MRLKIGKNQVFGGAAEANFGQGLVIIRIGGGGDGPDHGKIGAGAENVESELAAVGKKGEHTDIARVDIVDAGRRVFASDESFAFTVF